MSKRNPWVYVPTLYFAQGLPYTAVMMMSAVYLKDLGASNELIGFTSALGIPWSAKFAWAPLVDLFGIKKIWIVVAQLVLVVCLVLFTLSTHAPDPLRYGIAAMALIAIASATHDISIDGYYLEALNANQQALFVGVRNTAFRLSMIFGNGALVYMAGMLSAQMGKANAWMSAFAVLSGVMLLLFLLHSWYLPDSSKFAKQPGEADEKTKTPSPSAAEYMRAIVSYFQQPGAIAIVFYILLFRLGDAMVVKMIPPFLQDPVTVGGMGLTVRQIGAVYGTVGVSFLLLGGITGGYLVSRDGLKRWFWPATLLMNATILLYWMLAYFKPSSIAWVYVVNSLEQFGYGMGMAAYTVFLLSTVKKEFKAAHYAVASALMSVGLIGPGMLSGLVYNAVGYAHFFLLSFFLTVPGIISICFLPLWKKPEISTASTEE